MYLQGSLQTLFDALYSVGAIDPILKADWANISKKMEKQPHVVGAAVSMLNRCHGNMEALVKELRAMDTQSVEFIALEVAREFCEFQERETIH